MSSGGGSSQPTQQTITQTTIPEWAKPYATRVLGEAENLAYNQPYQQYTGQRIAGLNPLQQQAMMGTQGLGPTAQMGEASGLASLAGQQASQFGGYQPAQAQQFYQGPHMGAVGLGYQQVQTPEINQFAMSGPQSVRAQGYGPIGMSAAERVEGPNLQQFQMGPAERVEAERFGAPQMQEYMSPYMEGVVEQQKRAAEQDYLRQLPGLGAAAVRAGGRGGTRESLLQAEAQRGLQSQLQGIEATGRQAAFQQAAQQFGQDRAAQMQAAAANQQAGLTTGQQNLAALLGVQQLGTQTGLQAQLANQAAGLTVGQQNLAAEQARRQLMSQQGLQAQLANQQMGFNVGQQNLQAALSQQQLGAQTGLQAQQLNQAAQLQAQQQALAQQQGLNQLGMQGAGLQAQYGLAGAQLGEQSRQFGANLGLQGLQQQLAAAGMLGQLGGAQFGQQQASLQMQQQAGSQMQQLEQQRLQQQYDDFLAQQRYPYSQLAFMSDILRGTPASGSVGQMYQAPPSPLSTAAGLGSLYYGMQGRG
jgi:hypothetical protein